MQKIENRYGLNILIKFRPTPAPQGKLAFIQHGFSGSMVEPHIAAFAETYLKNGYDVVLMDCTNSFNDADGEVHNNTIQSHYEDLEDVISWAKNQEWYREPFALAGHSLGGLSILTYASKNPDKVRSLFPAATVISGRHLEEANMFRTPDEYQKFKTSGRMDIECTYKEGVTDYRPYSWIETMWDWNALNMADKITAPTLLVVGSEDGGTPPEHQNLLYDELAGPTEINIVDGVDHCYVGKVDVVCGHLDNWLKAL